MALMVVVFTWTVTIQIDIMKTRIETFKKQIKDAEIKCIMHNHVKH